MLHRKPKVIDKIVDRRIGRATQNISREIPRKKHAIRFRVIPVDRQLKKLRFLNGR